MLTRIQWRRDLAVNWFIANPVLALGEAGAEIDSNPLKFKLGDGVTPWNTLPYENNLNLGTVTSVSVIAANGISGLVTTPTTTPAISLTLGDITPSSVISSGVITGLNLSGNNTGDQTINLTGDITGLGTGNIATAIAPNTVTDAKLAQMPANTIKGNNFASTATPSDLNSVQVTALLNPFTSTLQGVAMPSGGGTTNFLRADGAWVLPPGGPSQNLTAQWITADGKTKTIVHNFGTFNVAAQVLDNLNNYANIAVDITRPTINSVTFTSTASPISAWTVLLATVLN